MSRNLVAAKAWKNGREQICKKCANFAERITNASRYDWNNCRKQRTKRINYFSMWDGKNCHYFVPKGEPR